MPLDMSAVKALADRVDALNQRADCVMGTADAAGSNQSKDMEKHLSEVLSIYKRQQSQLKGAKYSGPEGKESLYRKSAEESLSHAVETTEKALSHVRKGASGLSPAQDLDSRRARFGSQAAGWLKSFGIS